MVDRRLAFEELMARTRSQAVGTVSGRTTMSPQQARAEGSNAGNAGSQTANAASTLSHPSANNPTTPWDQRAALHTANLQRETKAAADKKAETYRRPGYTGNDMTWAEARETQFNPTGRSRIKEKSSPEDFRKDDEFIEWDPKREDAKYKRMTWEQYDALSENQRAAVDWNTLMHTARSRDAAAAEGLDEAGLEKYHEAVEGLFGEKQDSDLVAPESLAVLKSLEFDVSSTGINFDDMLEADFAFTKADLDTLKSDATDVLKDKMRADLTLFEQMDHAIIARMSDLRTKLTEGERLISTFTNSALAFQNVEKDGESIRSALGLGDVDTSGMTGFKEDSESDLFRDLLTGVSVKDEKKAREAIEMARSSLNDSQLDDFEQYALTRMKNAQQSGQSHLYTTEQRATSGDSALQALNLAPLETVFDRLNLRRK